MAGVSLTAAASPTPTPLQRWRRPNSLRSRNTNAIRSRFTWPKLTVSRTGSRAAKSIAATQKVKPRCQPRRCAIGSISHVSRAADAITVSNTLTAMASCQVNSIMGSMHRAAKGG